jgi:hypothetical protein
MLPTRFDRLSIHVPLTEDIFVLYGSQNKQRSYTCTALTVWFLQPVARVHCAVRIASLNKVCVFLVRSGLQER